MTEGTLKLTKLPLKPTKWAAGTKVLFVGARGTIFICPGCKTQLTSP